MLENKETREKLMDELKSEYDIEFDTFDAMYIIDDGCSMYINIAPIKEKILHDYKMQIYNEIERETRLCALDELVQICKRKKHVWHSFKNDENQAIAEIYYNEYVALRSTARELANTWGLEDATLHEILMQL